ncbi:collagen-like triple helix repeat-containing protein [Emticicia agri]|uniref:Collagen-like protein n=1 Tax=Emticicia agri TaxID=2492393 RepID=A0A4Q5LTK1_9BACT|nr:collagen-like protein [Emticicia agri]RYU92817.1 collagen-like protein [Emticicia agri]
MKKNIYSLFTLLLTVLLFNACKGPAGDPGPAGPQGAKGDIGAKGDPGTVSIISTGWITVSEELFKASYVPEDLITNIKFTGPDIDKISQKVLDDGIILVYNRLPTSKNVINAIPYTLDLNFYEPGLQLSYFFEARPKEVNCYIQFSKAVNDISDYVGTEEFRVVIIPGPSGLRLKNIDLRDYNAVKKAFNLED